MWSVPSGGWVMRGNVVSERENSLLLSFCMSLFVLVTLIRGDNQFPFGQWKKQTKKSFNYFFSPLSFAYIRTSQIIHYVSWTIITAVTQCPCSDAVDKRLKPLSSEFIKQENRCGSLDEPMQRWCTLAI